MPPFTFRSQPMSRIGQKNGTIRFGVHITGLLQPYQRAVDRHMSHTEPSRQIHDACLAQRNRQISNGLNVILRDFRRPVTTRTAKAFSLSRCRTHLKFARGG